MERVGAPEIELARAHGLHRLTGRQRGVLKVARAKAEGLEHQQGVRAGARPFPVQGEALAPQVPDRIDEGVATDHELQHLRIEVCDGAQARHGLPPLENTGSGVGPISDIGLRQAGMRRARLQRLDVGDRALRGKGHGDQLGRIGDKAGDHSADGKVSAAAGPGQDRKEVRLFR